MLFGGVDDHYFLTAAIPSGQPVRLEYEPVPVAVAGSETGLRFVSWSAHYPTAPSNARFFAGPKDFDVLAAVDPQLTYAIDFGMFRLARRSAAARAEVGQRLRRELRVVDHRPHHASSTW